MIRDAALVWLSIVGCCVFGFFVVALWRTAEGLPGSLPTWVKLALMLAAVGLTVASVVVLA